MKRIRKLQLYSNLLLRLTRDYNTLVSKLLSRKSRKPMIKALFREIARFIRSGFGELKISEARYENLLGEADEYHREYLRHLLMHLVIR